MNTNSSKYSVSLTSPFNAATLTGDRPTATTAMPQYSITSKCIGVSPCRATPACPSAIVSNSQKPAQPTNNTNIKSVETNGASPKNRLRSHSAIASLWDSSQLPYFQPCSSPTSL
jgi:hypothetical protein